MIYRICDFNLESNIVLPDLISVHEIVGDVTSFRLHNSRFDAYTSFSPSRQLKLRDDRIYLIIAKEDNDKYLLHFPWKADFVIDNDGRSIDCYPLSHFELDTIIHLLLNQVIPCILSQRGEMVLHASAVAVEGNAMVFVGRSGGGKSTLSASFYMLGYPMITDDYLLIKKEGEQFLGYPSYPGFRLWKESRQELSLPVDESNIKPNYKGKERISPIGNQRFSLKPLFVDRLYILSPPDDETNKEGIKITPIPLRDAFMEILYASYFLDTSDQNINKEGFRTISDAADTLEVYRLSYPREMSLLHQVQKTVLENI